MSDPRYYLVRTHGQSAEALSLFFENSVIAVGWGKVDFSAIDDPDELVKQVDGRYYKFIKIVPTTKENVSTPFAVLRTLKPETASLSPIGVQSA